ncbi:MAG: spore coat associated protein CotJA [Schaedlerella sp.]|nr:spore coat associated protein CotJA [Schaedlerella sp.]
MEDKCDNYYESECKEDLSTMPLAMAYVPWQKWCNIYEICKGFQRGTIFGELDKPFLGRGGCNR